VRQKSQLWIALKQIWNHGEGIQINEGCGIRSQAM